MEQRRNSRFAPILAGAVIALILFAGVELYHASFPVEADGGNLEACLTDFYNQGRQAALSPDIRLHDAVTLGDRTYRLVEIDGELGVAVLKRGLTGRDRIERLSYGGGSFRDQVVEQDGKKYLLCGGRNPGAERAGITVILEGFTYQLALPEQPYFLVCAEIDPRITDTHLDLDRLTVRDARGGDMTGAFLRAG